MTIELNGAQVYYEEHGEGKPLLLLHGWGGVVNSWLPAIQDFARTRRVVALDFPGHGLSSEPPEVWGVPEYAQMTAGLIRALGIEGCDVMAHSFGGRVALVLSATQPALVGRLVLTGVPGLASPKTPRQKLRGRVYKALRTLADNDLSRKLLGDARVDAVREALQNRFGSADYRALKTQRMRATFSRIVSQDLSPYLSQIRASALLIWGAQDTAAPLWMAQRMEKEMCDAGLVVFEDCAHFAYLDRYGDFSVIAHKFLD